MRVPGSQRLGLGATQIGGTNLSPTPVDAVPGAMPGNGGKNGSGSGFLGLADTIEVFDKARRENLFQKEKVSTSVGLIQAADALKDELNPDAILPKWEESTKTVRTKIEETYKNDEAVRDRLLNHVDQHATELGVHVRGTYRKRIVDQGKADGMVNEAELLKVIERGSPKEVEWALGMHQDDVSSKIESGIYSAVEAQERKTNFGKEAQKRAKELIVEDAYSKVFKQFRSNPHGAVKFLEDPENRMALGLSYGEANNLLANMDQQAARDKRRADEARTAGERSEKELYYRALEKSDLEGAAAILAKARNIPGAERMQMRQAITKDQWNDDPKVASEVQRKVWTGELTDVSQLTPLVGNGLSLKTARTLREDIDKLNKDAPDFPGAMNFYGNALSRYEAVFPKEHELHEHKGKFAATLTYMARKQNIGPFDPRMDGLADELLKVVEKPWFGADKTNFQKQFEDKALPGLDGLGSRPAPKPAAPAGAKPSSISQIPRDQYDAVKQALANAGKDTSDATITAVWKANRDKLKGAK